MTTLERATLATLNRLLSDGKISKSNVAVGAALACNGHVQGLVSTQSGAGHQIEAWVLSKIGASWYKTTLRVHEREIAEQGCACVTS